MASICLAVILFTVDGKDPEQNDYIQIFIFWLMSLLKSKSLTKNDLLLITVDHETLDYLERFTPMIEIINRLGSRLSVQKKAKPKSLVEGMVWRYINYEYKENIYIYCDIDILICLPINKLISQLETNTVYVYEEGIFSSEIYSQGILENELESIKLISSNLPGLNSGLFVITNNLQKKIIFEKMEKCINSTPAINIYYDQCILNKAIYTLLTEGLIHIDTKLLKNNIIHYNNGFMKKNNELPIFYDCNGDVAIGYRHLHRIINTFCFLNFNEL